MNEVSSAAQRGGTGDFGNQVHDGLSNQGQCGTTVTELSMKFIITTLVACRHASCCL